MALFNRKQDDEELRREEDQYLARLRQQKREREQREAQMAAERREREAERMLRVGEILAMTPTEHITMAAELHTTGCSSDQLTAHHANIQTHLLWALVKRES